jgi:hypothetical protein
VLAGPTLNAAIDATAKPDAYPRGPFIDSDGIDGYDAWAAGLLGAHCDRRVGTDGFRWPRQPDKSASPSRS